ncbi:MAG: ELM1/GtrOC1 family putative glycosyltransferase [Verrucomicrobiota bacterium]
MTAIPTIWLIGDGKPGHENQSLGLADAIARRVPCAVHRISIAGKRGLLNRVRTALRASAGLPKPDLIIAAGHATHFALLWLARKHRAKSIVLMRPSLPMAWFDLCIVPNHDFKKANSRKNLIVTRGALNRVAPPNAAPRSGGMILIGGPSSTHGWDGEALLAALAAITSNGGWQLTDSRRTPDGFIREISNRLPRLEIFPHQETTPDWLPARLARAAEVWVTEDSVSMVYEALTSGASVGLLPVPRLLADSRVLRGLEQLVAESFLTPFSAWEKCRRLGKPPSILREADRCAEKVIQLAAFRA